MGGVIREFYFMPLGASPIGAQIHESDERGKALTLVALALSLPTRGKVN